MSLQTRLASLVTAIGADIKSLQTQINALSVGSGPWSEQILTTAHNNSTTTASEPFAGFDPAPNTRYLIECVALISSNAQTVGVQTALAGPTSGIPSAGVKIVTAASTTADKVDHLLLNSFQTATAGLTIPNIYNLQAIVDVGANPAAGNIRLQMKAENNTQVTMRAGALFRWRTL